jgi:sarcosine oxidase subunit beta
MRRRRPTLELGAAHATPLRPEADVAEVAIVGGGIMGLALAYELGRCGVRDVVVLEAHHLAWGASGRNGGGVRQQWSTELNIRLMQESLDICRGFASELGVNIWMRQGGYLFLAQRPETLRRLEAAIALQNACDVPTRMLEPSEASALVPELDVGPFAGGCYNPTDAIVFPWPFLWGYARAASKGGAEIHTMTPVLRIDVGEGAGGAFVLHTRKGRLQARRVLDAAGAWSREVARLVGVELPTWPERHEILSTEPLKPFLRPLVSVLDSGLYVSQSLRGELVGGLGLPEPREDRVNLGSSLGFLQAMARALVDLMPRLAQVKVIRQWAGPYDHSPDGDPLVGESSEVPGFFLSCGFVGHGFMMAPVVARHYARLLAGAPPHPLFAAWSPARLGRGAAPMGGGEHMNIG